MTCEKIDSKEKLISVLEKLNSLIDSGTLVQVYKENDSFCTKISVSEILKSGEIPDFMRLYFSNVETKETFLLSAEAYHGAGGELKKLE